MQTSFDLCTAFDKNVATSVLVVLPAGDSRYGEHNKTSTQGMLCIIAFSAAVALNASVTTSVVMAGTEMFATPCKHCLKYYMLENMFQLVQ